ncbi:MAG: hypothetical protein HXY41_12785 [Chloroflexi bacterium]|nr:hypothetical protein [Chloroflexota bacterium]
MLPLRIIPRYRLLLQYDIRPETYESYYEYVVKEFVPAMQDMGLPMVAVWQTVYGDYPARQVDFVADNLKTMNEVLQSDRWQNLETRLIAFTHNYSRKLVHYRDGFQF